MSRQKKTGEEEKHERKESIENNKTSETQGVRVLFTTAAVRGVLTNPVYVGDIEFGRTPSRNVITGELDEEQYHRYIENHHKGIIDRETWNAAKAMLEENRRDPHHTEQRDQRVYDLLTEGVKNKDIALRLGIPIWQVNASVKRLKEKKWI